LSLWSTF